MQVHDPSTFLGVKASHPGGLRRTKPDCGWDHVAVTPADLSSPMEACASVALSLKGTGTGSPPKADTVFLDFSEGDRVYYLVLLVIHATHVTSRGISQGITIGHKNIR